jgi:hypothetical protein
MAVNAVFQSLLQHCRPFQLGGLWNVEVDQRHGLACPANGPEALTSLLEEHSPEALLEAGVAEQLETGLALSEWLAGDGRAVIAMRNSADAAPYALLTGNGSLPHGHVAALAVLDDEPTHRCLAHSRRRFFLAFTIEDAMLLRALNLPAATTTGFERVTVEELSLLAGMCAAKVPVPPETPVESDLLVELVLVGCSPTELSLLQPGKLVATAERLLALEWHNGIDLSHVAVWVPTPNELARLQFFVRDRNLVAAAEALQRSTEDSLFRLDAVCGDLSIGTHAGLIEARHRLCEALDMPGMDREPAHLAQLRRLYDAAVDGDIVRPMLERAAASEDPSRRSLEIALAEQSGLILKHLPFVGREIDGAASITDLTKMLREQRASYRELRR